MGWNKELQDFVSGFQSGRQLVRSPDEKAYDSAKMDYLRAQTEATRASTENTYDTMNRRNEEANNPFAIRITDIGDNVQNLGLPFTPQPRTPQAVPDGTDQGVTSQGNAGGDTSGWFNGGGGGGGGGSGAAAPSAPATPAPAQATPTQAIPDQAIPADDAGTAPQDADTDAPQTTGAIGQQPDMNSPQGRRQTLREGVKMAMDGLFHRGEQMGIYDRQAVGDDRGPAYRRYMQGYGAAPGDQVRAAEDAIDPEHKLSPGQRRLQLFGAIARQAVLTGDTDKAKKAASALVGYYQFASSAYASQAAAAAASGNMDKAVESLTDAYDLIPDGRGLRAAKQDDGTYRYEIFDETTGEVEDSGALTPAQVRDVAMQAAPSDFVNMMLRGVGLAPPGPSAAAQRIAEALRNGKPGDPNDWAALSEGERAGFGAYGTAAERSRPKPLSPEDFRTIQDETDSAIEVVAGSLTDEGVQKTFLDNKPMLDAIISGVMTVPGNRTTPRTAAGALAGGLAITKDNLDSPTYQVIGQDENKGTVQVQFGNNGIVLDIPVAQFVMYDRAASGMRAVAAAAKGKELRRAEEDRRNSNRLSSAPKPGLAIPAPPDGRIPSTLEERNLPTERSTGYKPFTEPGPLQEEVMRRHPELSFDEVMQMGEGQLRELLNQ